MHPKTICNDFMQLGSKIVQDGEDLFIENHEKLDQAHIEHVKLYKPRIIRYLKGEYSDKEHALRSTMDKAVAFMINQIKSDIDQKLNDWLRQDEESLKLVMRKLELLYENGWRYELPAANFETAETDKLAQQIFDRAMAHFKGV